MTEPKPNVRDLGVSLIRTWVPALWGMFLAWGATQLPALEPVLNEAGMVGLGGVLAATLTGLWYTLWRSVERRIPAWLTVLLLGSNSTPVYVDGTVNSVVDRPADPPAFR